ncbi:MAG: DUF2520 domain-containing protein [Prevotella sp.]|jgi:predicted short-subunit dehydrogenase-like oxidoreductase (DUF2520 family)|nr:DUF2520 domain-containing protein [Prevotella sp.]
MKVVFIGAGNVATHLAVKLYEHSFDIAQVYSRTPESASLLASLVHAAPVTDIASVTGDADLYIFSVKDSVIESLASKLPRNKGIWIHTAGSVPLDVFGKFTSRYGVLYPFQTFSKYRSPDWRDIAVFIEASDAGSLSALQAVARQLSDKVSVLSSGDRKYVHLAGVFVCNFTNHMYALSKLFLEKANLPFDIALPLIDETALKVRSLTPEKAQTGPAIRHDENVIGRHLEMIEDEKTREIYRLISENIHKMSR